MVESPKEDPREGPDKEKGSEEIRQILLGLECKSCWVQRNFQPVVEVSSPFRFEVLLTQHQDCAKVD